MPTETSARRTSLADTPNFQIINLVNLTADIGWCLTVASSPHADGAALASIFRG
jgi:hypothetical protein